MTAEPSAGRVCTVVLHDGRVSAKSILCGARILHAGELGYLTAPGAKTLCITPDGLASGSDEVSIHISLASRFGFENRVRGLVTLVENAEAATAMHVELLFRDQYLSRADMWQIMRYVDDTIMYRGQTLDYLGTPTAEVKKLYIAGRDVDSAYISHPQTKPIFRSGSARFTLLIEISSEMLDSWNEADLMYERLVNGFLPDLFRRWDALKARHHLSVVLFGRRADSHLGEDFFHLVVSEMQSTEWPELLRNLKRIFNCSQFPRPVSLAAQSNMLEAIHLTALDYADDQNDASVTSSGTSIIAVTAGTGLFESDRTLLKQTTDLLIGNSIGVDLVSLSPKPFHPVPLFQYTLNGAVEYALPHWVDISFWDTPQPHATSVWTMPVAEGPVRAVAIKTLAHTSLTDIDSGAMDYYDIEAVRDATCAARPVVRPRGSTARTQLVGSVDTVKAVNITAEPPQHLLNAHAVSSNASQSPSIVGMGKMPVTKPIKSTTSPHPLMQVGRKISLGPKGLALGRAAASTTLSSAQASHGKDFASTTGFIPNDTSSGLAMAIRASLARKPSQQSLAPRAIGDSEQSRMTRPIDIPTGHEETDQERSSDPANAIEKQIADTILGGAHDSQSSPSTTLKGRSGAKEMGEAILRNESLDMLAPWVMLLNPCNPRRDNMRIASQYRKWQHVFPRAISSGAFKWASMCSPAALPITAEYRPSSSELDIHYTKKVRRHTLLHSAGLKRESARNLIERLIDVRLIRGFQVVAIPNSGSDQTFQSKDRPILLALGKRYHELQRLSDFEVQIVQYEPKAAVDWDNEKKHYLTSYEPNMQTVTGAVVNSEISYHSDPPIVDWTPLDEYILGLESSPDTRALFKMRLCLIPVDIHKSDQNARIGLSDDERRIEAIQLLTQTWQRFRYFSAEDQQRQASLVKSRTTPIAAERDPNPLAIDYQTRDPSAVMYTYGPTLSNQFGNAEPIVPLFAESDKHHSSTFDVIKLVKQMQEAPPYGVEMRDRRWFTMTHLKCFRGDEMTTWLLSVFKDLELREDAVAVGNELIKRSIFTHVRQKHAFRDGHYFYQVVGAYRTTDYPDTASLFSKAPWRSIPATPLIESLSSPLMRPVSHDSGSSGRDTPVVLPADQRRLVLSQVLQYNVDSGKKSDHLQIVDLHYDRIHNPENCYHIQLEWMSASAKLVRDSVVRWSALVESHGLKMVQLPLQEAAKLREHHPFDQPEVVSLAAKPPDSTPFTPIIDPQFRSPRLNEDRLIYHKALLRRKLDFVLDYEAAQAFPVSSNVTYSWGLPNYTFTQFVHTSGLVLAQILNNGSGDFLLLPNRLALNRLSSTSRQSESESAASIITHFKAICGNGEELQIFYESIDRHRPSITSPIPQATPGADADVPALTLAFRAQTQRHSDTQPL